MAGIQLTANKMLQRGDWIAMPNRDLNGEVIDVSLTTVKVRNWDNSVTTVPPYSLITDSFRNYRPMQISGGRRVDRSIYIDINTVRLVSDDELSRLCEDGLVPDDNGDDVRNRRGGNVNLRLLRDYLEWYLRTHPGSECGYDSYGKADGTNSVGASGAVVLLYSRDGVGEV